MTLIVMARANLRFVFLERYDKRYYIGLERNPAASAEWTVRNVKNTWSDYEINAATNVVFLTKTVIRNTIPDIICEALKNEGLVVAKAGSTKRHNARICKKMVFDILEAV